MFTPIQRRDSHPPPASAGPCVVGFVGIRTLSIFDEVKRAIRNWIRWYKEMRPHGALDHRSRRRSAINYYNSWLEPGERSKWDAPEARRDRTASV